ncbi:MAG TPA: zinc-ribbon domain-containing protein, partial [Gemmatimonadales bacterium]|nr:zinc-ribbon domain-containing protein [Gemmatimonadales bacterium]
MVVVCESCSTRFRIDDARIPAKGRLVRCSQCKATFIAKPEDASFEETVQEVVAEVTGSGGAPVPEPAADLFDTGGEDLGDTVTRPGKSADD